VNLAAIIDPHPAEHPALLLEDGRMVTYGDLRHATTAARDQLVEAGIHPGDRVALLSSNHPDFVVAYLAVLGLGAVAVPLNPTSPDAELSRELETITAAALVAAGAGVRAAAGLNRPILALTGPGPAVDGASPGPAPAPVLDRQPSDLAVLSFTAGTGGAPRPAMLTHGNLLANIEQVHRHGRGAVASDDVVLGVLPLFHILGLNAVLGGALSAGAAVLLLDHFDPPTDLGLIVRHGVTLLLGPPTMYAALAAVPSAGPEAMATVRLAYCGAAPLPLEVAEAWQRRFGQRLLQGYGLTEASPVVTSALPDQEAPPTSVGVPLPGVQVRLVDEEGEDALSGDPGELWVQGDNVFPGYWQDDEATRQVLTTDGWLRTGDVAVAGDDGQLYIVDRAKDLIIVSGFNVYPMEVEDALLDHPAVAEAAVVSATDPYRGERIRAFVVLRPGAELTTEQLTAFCSERLASYKCPSDISFVPSLPHGLAGKLLRRALRSSQADTTAALDG
jgi:long-chain acyl-CoA synthetase